MWSVPYFLYKMNRWKNEIVGFTHPTLANKLYFNTGRAKKNLTRFENLSGL